MHGFYNLSSLIDKVSFKSNNMALALVLLEKLLTLMCTPQSDAIMSADIKIFNIVASQLKDS